MISKTRGLAFAAVLLVSVVGQAGAVKAVAPDTSNPNRVVLNRGVEDSTTDARLDKKITLKMENKRLPEVLAEVSKQTGVDIYTDREARFWAVKQRKVTVFAKDMPLREFMRELKRLLGYHIRTAGKADEPRYIVWQDLKGRKIEQDMLNAQKQEKEAYKERSAYETISDAKRALSMSPEEIEQAKKSDPWLAYLAADPEAKLLCKILSEMTPKDLMKQGEVTLSASQKEAITAIAARAASPEQEQRFSEMYGDQWKSTYGGIGTSNTFLYLTFPDPDNPSSGSSATLQVNVGVTDPAQSYVSLTAATFTIRPSNERNYEAFVFSKQQEGMSKKEAQSSYYRESNKLRREGYSDDDINRILRGEHVEPKRITDKEAKDPTLAKTYEIEPDTKDRKQSPFCAALEELAKETNCNVMYECFPVRESGYGRRSKQEKLINILDNMAKDNKLDWEKDGNTIRFRLKDWAERRSWEIPEEWVEAWYQSIKKNNGLSLDEMTDMATNLTDTQIEHNFGMNQQRPSASVDDPKVSKLISLAGAHMVKDNRRWLELYGRLSESEKILARSEEGLPIDNVPQEWWPDILLNDQYPPVYGGVFIFSQGPSPSLAAGKIRMGAKVKYWLRDFPEDVRERMLSVMPPDKVATVDDEPITVPLGCVIDLSSPDNWTKKLVDQIELERKNAAEEAKKAASESTEQ